MVGESGRIAEHRVCATNLDPVVPFHPRRKIVSRKFDVNCLRRNDRPIVNHGTPGFLVGFFRGAHLVSSI
jgi:hypothetical protein